MGIKQEIFRDSSTHRHVHTCLIVCLTQRLMWQEVGKSVCSWKHASRHLPSDAKIQPELESKITCHHEDTWLIVSGFVKQKTPSVWFFFRNWHSLTKSETVKRKTKHICFKWVTFKDETNQELNNVRSVLKRYLCFFPSSVNRNTETNSCQATIFFLQIKKK